MMYPAEPASPAECAAWSARNRGRRIEPGRYMALVRLDGDGEPETWMSDAEWHDHRRVLAVARGRVVVTGLGLGCVVRAMLARGRVEHVTVVEREPDVIAMVWPALALAYGDRVALHRADALTGELPAGEWDLAWHDIWPTISAAHIPDMFALRLRYRGRARRQLCWGEGLAWAELGDHVRARLIGQIADRARAVVTPLHEHFSPARLAQVVAEMRRRGPPRIRAYFDAVSVAWFCFEGTHRLRAALQLGIAPVLVPVRWHRGPAALVRARHAARIRGHVFARVEVAS